MEPQVDYAAAVAREVRASIARLGITQGELADATGIAPSTLSRRLSGESSLDMGEIFAISGVLGITPSELLRRAENHSAGAA